jgi:hypothetical protein
MAKFDEFVENTAGMRFAPEVTISVGAAVTAVSRNAPARLRVMVVELYILRWLLMSSFRGEGELDNQSRLRVFRWLPSSSSLARST